MTSNGPDVHVAPVREDDRALEQEVVKGELEHVELGALKGNQGNHNYDLPATVDLHQYQAVAMYCERFHAIFGVARLEVLAAQIPQGLTPIDDPENCVSY
jgi:hypothetical protein